MTHKKRLFIASVAAALVAAAVLLTVTASAASANVDVTTSCSTGWYVNDDEGALAPVQTNEGLKFDGPRLVHHDFGPIKLVNLTPGSFTADVQKNSAPLLKYETINVDDSGHFVYYSTVNQTKSGEALFWSSKIPAGDEGGQDHPVAIDMLITLWHYNADTLVTSFGIGYANDTGNTAIVTSITFAGTTYPFICSPSTTTPTTPAAKPTTHAPTHAPTSSTQTGGHSGTSRRTTTAANNDVYPAIVPFTSASPSASVTPSEQDVMHMPVDSVSASPSNEPIAQAPDMKKTSHTGWKLTGLGAIALGIVLLAGLAVMRRRHTDHSDDDTQYISRHQ